VTTFIVVALALSIGIMTTFGIGRVLRRDYDTFNGPLPALTPALRYRVTGGQDPIAVALALDHAGFHTIERYVRGDTVLHISVHTGSPIEREAIRSMIFNAPTLEGAESHPSPASVVFVDEEAPTPITPSERDHS
jgi:hypothetical protein